MGLGNIVRNVPGRFADDDEIEGNRLERFRIVSELLEAHRSSEFLNLRNRLKDILDSLCP